jgi:hypothetical protein
VLNASIIALMVAAVSTSDMSVNFYQTTWHNIPEDSHLHSKEVGFFKTEPKKTYKILLWNNISVNKILICVLLHAHHSNITAI